MKLYHGSKHNFEKIKNNPDRNGNPNNVLEKQNLNGIYLTPDYKFAIVMASRPQGHNHIDTDKKIAEFENFNLFNPEQDIFIYTFDSKKIPTKNLEYIDNLQYVVKGENELIPIEKESLKAKEILKYYKIQSFLM